MRHAQPNGFSLIELMIVIIIILIIAAVAIPNLLKAKITANEASAVSSIHQINVAELTYTNTFPGAGYAATLANLGPGGACNSTANACLIDAVLAGGMKSGYTFTYVPVGGAPASGYTLNADPNSRGLTGQHSYYSDQAMATHSNATAVAGPADPQLQ